MIFILRPMIRNASFKTLRCTVCGAVHPSIHPTSNSGSPGENRYNGDVYNATATMMQPERKNGMIFYCFKVFVSLDAGLLSFHAFMSHRVGVIARNYILKGSLNKPFLSSSSKTIPST
ncbi:hypothetical protein Y032_0003g1682 [Ancylostoma ceylanicum]|uniref:Uncharacterized protein n=1 Tax=Ancylostoma ceylanicum TaxID=53326 RepID=A0A016VYZ2_9BILA|nr:hypothetical protein Y032_0003g1682 [Ancylostoma ceylanicum]